MATSIALTLLWIAGGCIGIGIVLTIIGILADKPVPVRRVDGTVEPPPSFISVLLELMKKAFAIITDQTSSRWKKLAAFGMLLIFLGFGFLAASAVAALVSIFSGGGDPTPSGTPTPSVSSS